MVRTVCLIDDDKIYLFIMRRLLSQLGLCEHVIEFSDPSDALEFFTQNPDPLPELVLVDMNMPVMDGWDFLKEYHKLEQNWPQRPTVYMVSSSIDKADMERAGKEPVLKGYLTKPLSTETLHQLFGA